MANPNAQLFRRFLLGTAFTAAFIWVAVRYFDVDTEVIWVLFVFSVAFVIGLIGLGIGGAFLVRLLRRDYPSMLDRIERTEGEVGEAEKEKEEKPSRAEE